MILFTLSGDHHICNKFSNPDTQNSHKNTYFMCKKYLYEILFLNTHLILNCIPDTMDFCWYNLFCKRCLL